ncbi:dihydrolipoyl dehydrogenase family protein [Kineococcus sp. SYSU DK006]|uniref:dihydrolipoyl dehydrogenase family protein n=1 Tax=Kineococcus sp. SYSU DK006 TaxID=3383127 RepID=UPI003D7CF2EA
MSTQEREVDVVVIGAGAVGENVADRAGRTGLEVVVVESELVGGECSYWACMPSKALLRSGQALAAARRLPGAAEAVTGTLDAGKVLARRTSFTSDWDDASQAQWLESAGLGLVRGTARLAGPKRVEVATAEGTTTLVARHAVVLSTGSEPVLPDVPGLAEAQPWTSREATSAKSVPARLAVLGGGVVGVELAQAWARLGSRVTLLVRGALLRGQEEFAGEVVADALRADGVDVRSGAELRSVSRDAEGFHLVLGDGSTLTADEFLVATGRRPRTGGIGLETVGLEDGGALEVDDSGLVAGVDGAWLYATGDVSGRVKLTHQGKYDARAAGDAIAARAAGTLEGTAPAWSRWAGTATTSEVAQAVPQVVFTDPEVAQVGLTAAVARERGFEVRVVDYEIGDVAGASLVADGYTGRARMVVDERRRVVLGVTFVGQDVAELLHAATIAIVGEVPIDRLWHAVPSYPTISEVWLRLLEAYGL